MDKKEAIVLAVLIVFAILTICVTLATGEEYHGQKDRYNVALLRYDPEVLIAKAKHDSRYAPEPVVFVAPVEASVVVVSEDAPIKVTSCVEYNGECQESDEFVATVK